MCGFTSPQAFLSVFVSGLVSLGLIQAQQPTPEKTGKPTHPSLTFSREVPVVFTRSLAPLLTPLKTVLDRRADFPAAGHDGVILLDETIIHADEKGLRTLVYHSIEEAKNESGAEGIGEMIHSFRTEDQKIHLIEAHTILPDGTKLPVEDRAVIMESPQSDAGDSLYGDRGQMRVIFSGTRPGAVREAIVVVEETSVRIAGHFSTIDTWGPFWPCRMSRTVVHMPDSIASRLRETSVGAGVPAAVKVPAGQGWQTWTYQKERISPLRSEGGRPPLDQVGPAVFLTTLPDWETMGTWYRGLLKERSTLTEPMKDLAKQWTKDCKTDAEKVDAVLSHIARDVRYTGLEFGLGALQPRDPVQVWQTSYGDCKDKSNLTALLLRSLGIEARLTLIQTEHAGLIERRSPDTRHFNHAIVAVKTPDGWQFSDPTIRYAKPGMLAPSSSDRDVLIMTENGIEWTRTPVSSGGQVHYHIDAARDADGTLEGWLELHQTGYYYAADQAYYERMSRDEMKRDVQQYVTALLPGGRMIDLDIGKPGTDVTWRAFFSIPGQVSGNDEREPLRFPAGNPVMLSVGDEETRESNRFLWPITWQMTSRITLPKGWKAVDVPSPFDLHTDAYEVQARWELQKDACLSHYQGKVTRALLEPKTHAIVWRGTQALKNWLQKPLWLGRDDSTLTAELPVSASLDKFPLMPTGEGQLALVEERYPSGGDPALRRAALRKTLDYFPDDAQTVFMARARLALVDWDVDENDKAEKALRELLANPSPKVDAETLAWSRYMLGTILQNTKKYAEAVRELEPMVQRQSLSEYRRSWAGFQLSLAQHGLKETEKALKTAQDALHLHVPEITVPLLGQVASLLFELKREKEFPAELKTLLEADTAAAPEILTRLAKWAHGWVQEDRLDLAAYLLQLLDQPGTRITAGSFVQAHQAASAALAGKTASAGLQKKLQEYLKQHPDLPAVKPPTDGWPENAQACANLYAKADKAVDSETAVKLSLYYATAYPVDEHFGRYLWQAAAHQNALERQTQAKEPSPLLKRLMELGMELPKSSETYYEVAFLRGRMLESWTPDWKATADYYEGLIVDTVMEDGFRTTAIERQANCYEKLGEWKKVAESLTRMTAFTKFGSAGDSLARAAQIRLELGEVDEALRLLKAVESNRKFLLESSNMADILTEWLDVAKNEIQARERWQLKPAWWPAWEKLQSSLGIKPTEIEPIIMDVGASGGTLQQAVQDKDLDRAGQIYRQFAHSARWLPARATDTAWMSLYRLAVLHPTLRNDFRKFTLELMGATRPVTDEQGRIRLMYLTSCFMDTQAPAEAQKRIEEYFKTYPDDAGVISAAMGRLWATLAMEVKDQQKPALEKLQAQLASKEPLAERSLTISLAADLLAAQNRHADIKPMLEEGLKHPAIAGDAAETEKLQNLLKVHGASDQQAAAIKRWLAKHAPAWYDAAPPKSLKDEGLEDLDTALENAGELPVPERLKLYFLAALEGPHNVDQKSSWWSWGFSNFLQGQALTRAQFEQAITDLIEDADAPDLIKDNALRIAAVTCATLMDEKGYRFVRSKLSRIHVSEFSQSYFDCLDLGFDTDLKSTGAITAAIQKQSAQKETQMLGYLCTVLQDRAIRQGRMEAITTISESLGKVRKGGADAAMMQAMRLEIARNTTGIKKILPVHAALEKVLLQHTSDADLQAKIPDLFGTVSDQRLGAVGFRAWMAEAVKAGSYDRRSLQVWHDYLNACAEFSPARTWDLRKALITAAFGAASEDLVRASLVLLALNGVDSDSDSEKAFLEEVLKPFRDSTKMPLTYAEIRAAEAHIALRSGQTMDIAAILPQVKAPGMELRLKLLNLAKVLNEGDVPTIERALDTLGADAILAPDNVAFVFPALKKCGREAELVLAQEAAETALKTAVLESWTGLDTAAVRQALNLAEVTGRVDALPEAWVKSVYDAYPERQDQLVLTMKVALMKKDWEAALKASAEVVGKYPSFYANYWAKGKALWELGRKTEAAAPLRTFVQYCHDEHNHADAEKMLKELEKP